MSKLLVYTPDRRLTPLQVMCSKMSSEMSSTMARRPPRLRTAFQQLLLSRPGRLMTCVVCGGGWEGGGLRVRVRGGGLQACAHYFFDELL